MVPIARCSGCSGDRCSCKIVAGSNILVTGAGTSANPYTIEGAGSGGDGGASRIVGEIIGYGGSTAPAGWLVCDGSPVSRVTYAGLWTILGITYGPGDGANTFNLPDLAGRFGIGADGTYARGSIGGGIETTLTLAHIPAHTHTIAHTHTFTHDHDSVTSGVNGNHSHNGGDPDGPLTKAGEGDHGHTPFDTSDGGGQHQHDHPSHHSNAAGNNANTYNEGTSGATSIPNEGGHKHTINVPAGSGDHRHHLDIPANGDHTHSVDIPTHTGSTSASSASTSGSTGNGTPDPIGTLPPYTALTYLIKT